MDRTEFRQWYLEHRAAFPAIDAWLGRMAKASDGVDAVKAVDVLRQWERALQDVTYDEACAATQALLRGDADEPRSFEGHPRAIRRLAFDARGVQRREAVATRRYVVDGEETYSCPRCCDMGYVRVYRRETVRAWRQGKEYPPHRDAYPYVVLVNCDCTSSQPEWTRKYARYDATIDLIPTPFLNVAERCDELRAATAQASVGETFDADAWH